MVKLKGGGLGTSGLDVPRYYLSPRLRNHAGAFLKPAEV